MLLARWVQGRPEPAPTVFARLVEDLCSVGVASAVDRAACPNGRFSLVAELSGRPKGFVSMHGWRPNRTAVSRSLAVPPDEGAIALRHGKAAPASRPSPPPSRWRWPPRRKVLWSKSKGAGIARLFDVPPLPMRKLRSRRERSSTPWPSTSRRRSWRYLAMFYNLGLADRAMRRIGAVEFATTIAPGLRDVLSPARSRRSWGVTKARQEAFGL